MATTFDVVLTGMFTGNVNTMAFPLELHARITEFLGRDRYDRPKAADAFPELTPDQREFLMTGTTPQEWDYLFCDDGE